MKNTTKPMIRPPPNVAFIGFVFLTTFCILTVTFLFLPDKNAKKLTDYFNMVAPLSILAAVVGVFLSQTMANNQQNAQIITQSLSLIENDIEKFDRYITEKPILIEFWKSIEPNNKVLQSLPNPKLTSQQLIDQKYEELYACKFMFQIIENYVTFIITYGYQYNDENGEIWIQIFKNWFKNKLVREQWQDIYKKQAGFDTNFYIDNYILS